MCEAGSDDDEDASFGDTWGLNVRDQDSVWLAFPKRWWAELYSCRESEGSRDTGVT